MSALLTSLENKARMRCSGYQMRKPILLSVHSSAERADEERYSQRICKVLVIEEIKSYIN